MPSNSKDFYRRRLPHYQPAQANFFVTYRLTGSLPLEVVKQLMRERDGTRKQIEKEKDPKRKERLLEESRERYFGRFDGYLDTIQSGNKWLSNDAVAGIVNEAMLHRDESVYDLFAFSIMPNHVHQVFSLAGQLTEPPTPRTSVPPYIVTDILSSLKKFTALHANRILCRKGQFWQHETYDHVVRDNAELERIIQYVAYNPVSAGLCKSWREWKWTYVAAPYVKSLA